MTSPFHRRLFFFFEDSVCDTAHGQSGICAVSDRQEIGPRNPGPCVHAGAKRKIQSLPGANEPNLVHVVDSQLLWSPFASREFAQHFHAKRFSRLPFDFHAP